MSIARFNPWADGNGRGGAFTVGIIGAKVTVSSKGSLGFQTFQNIGLGGYKAGAFVSTSLFSTGGISWLTAGWGTTTVSRDATTVLQYGGYDKQYSFGSAVLYAQCYDAWPASQTVFDSRYNAVMHFNPSQNTTLDETELIYEDLDVPNPLYENNILVPFERERDVIRSPVEYRVPTMWGGSYAEIADGTIINKDYNIVSEDEWIVKTDRNDKLLPYFYLKNVIGANAASASMVNRGEKVVVDDILSGSNNTKIKVTSATDGKLNQGGFVWVDYGEGFKPTDFSAGSYDINFDKGVVVSITSAKVWGRPMIDKGPNKQFEPTLISAGSNRGLTAGAQAKQTDLTLPNPNSSQLYDVFLFFQNDVGIASLFPYKKGEGPHFITVDIQ